jgi:hypothetical protein
MNTDHATEDRRILARCAVCQVEHCADCKTVHVKIGHTSLRLTMVAFLSLRATMLEVAHTATAGAVHAVAHQAVS